MVTVVDMKNPFNSNRLRRLTGRVSTAIRNPKVVAGLLVVVFLGYNFVGRLGADVTASSTMVGREGVASSSLASSADTSSSNPSSSGATVDSVPQRTLTDPAAGAYATSRTGIGISTTTVRKNYETPATADEIQTGGVRARGADSGVDGGSVTSTSLLGAEAATNLSGSINSAREIVDRLTDSAKLVSLSAAQELAATGEYATAWVDATNSAAILVPSDTKKNAPLLVFYPEQYTDRFLASLDASGVDVRVGPSIRVSTGGGGGSSLIAMLLFGLVVALVFNNSRRNRGSGRMKMNASSGQGGGSVSTRHRSAENKDAQGGVPETRFADVAGVDEAVEEMREVVEFLTKSERFELTGAKAPRGALLTGPPGTGKTLLARAVAGEAGVPFFAVTGSDFVEMYVGVGAKRVRELFDKARKADKAIVFIDEIDAVARKRSSDGNAGQAESENTLIALLAEMDGFVGTHVIVLAATNRADILDPAITRPGRLDRKVTVSTPDRRGREQILQVHSKNKPLSDDVDFVAIARRTPGMSGADLANLVNEACLEAARRDQSTVDAASFDAAVATVAMGRARTSALVTEHDREVTAWHEAGHTVCALLQEDADDPVSVSIVPRGPAGGVTWMSGNDDLFLAKRRAEARLVTAMGGRAAEELLLDGSYTQGAHGDLESATDLALSMATQYGMTRLGLMVRSPQMMAADGMTEINEVVEELLVAALERARETLRRNRPLFDAVVAELLDKETLTSAQITEIHKRTKKAVLMGSRPLLLDEVPHGSVSPKVKQRPTVAPRPAAQSPVDDVRVPEQRPSVEEAETVKKQSPEPTPVERPVLERLGRLLEVSGRVARKAARRKRRSAPSAG